MPAGGDAQAARPARPVRGRHLARKRAVDLLFEAEARGLSSAQLAAEREVLAAAKPEVAPLHPYTATVARGVSEHTAHIDDLISSHLQGWTLQRLPAVDRAMARDAPRACSPTRRPWAASLSVCSRTA